jgi:tetratricopeptide (TPR) repeat protein
VAAAYRVHDFRILYGASNSALFATWTLLTDPGAFHAYLASSPMIGWCAEWLGEQAAACFARDADAQEPRWLHLVYSDDDFTRVVEPCGELVARLEASAPPWLIWRHEVRGNEGHVPAADLILGLQAVFPDYNPIAEPTSLAALTGHYERLGERYGFALPPPAERLFDLGMDFYQESRLEEAAEVFEDLRRRYPDLPRGPLGLALVARRGGRLEEALQWTERALEIDPESSLGQRLKARIAEELAGTEEAGR